MTVNRIWKGQPPYEWISSTVWLQCRYLSWKIGDLSKLCLSIVNMPPQWTAFKNNTDVFKMMAHPYVCENGENPDFVFHWEQLSVFLRFANLFILNLFGWKNNLKYYLKNKIILTIIFG